LVGHAIQEAGHSGFRSIVAIVLGCNQSSLDFLKRFEFSINGTLPGVAKVNTTYVDHIYLSRDVPRNGPLRCDRED
jgi:L-amino acid N-acyltransferase YncA